ncbi:hypothetical protein [Prevotella sp. E2-28]|uniref:hypothetical protein n=1 Tax=Prevotella sp. E2-28 TaxID=2913620 RepID=UPI001EDA2667|nr:hypothetical protein [Prevotella sp. E2-28]UKK52691.1 hypothetical protein L6465_08745 [Prevotella sp. E2-28]
MNKSERMNKQNERTIRFMILHHLNEAIICLNYLRVFERDDDSVMANDFRRLTNEHKDAANYWRNKLNN